MTLRRFSYAFRSAAVAAALVLALAGCTSTPDSSDQPLGGAVRELFGTMGTEEPVRVAVLPLVDAQSENPDELGAYIADDIVYEISVRLPERVQVVERDRIVELMRELELTNLSGVISDRDAKRMGEMSGADLLLIGTKLEMDETIQTRLRLVDVEAAEVRGAARATLPMTAEYASVRGSTEPDVTDASAAGEPMALAADGSDEALDATVAPVATVATASAAAAPISISLGLGALAHLPVHEAVSPGFASRAGAILGHVSLPLYGDVALGYSRAGTTGLAENGPLSTLSVAAGGGYLLSDVLPFDLRAGGRLGYGLATLRRSDDSGSAGSLFWSGGMAAEFDLSERVGLTFEAGVSTQTATYLAFEAGVGVAFRAPFGSSRGRAGTSNRELQPEPLDLTSGLPVAITRAAEYTGEDLELVDAGFGLVFPVFYRYYNEAPIGVATLRNTGSEPVESVEVRVNIPRFMDLPQRQMVPTELQPGGAVTFDIQVLFNDGLLGVTEGTQVAAEISVSYKQNDRPVSYSINTVLDVANRNAMTWDDDRKAAAFVTARDPALLGYARTVAGIGRSDDRLAVNDRLRTAIAILSAFDASGLDYVIDPVTPHTERSESGAIDFLLFPVQTFQFGGGDCDDLSIAYAAALEAVGIEAAFITTPGHIYCAFNTGTPEAEYRGISPDRSRMIIRDGDVWIPVDPTLLDRGFIRAWDEGIRLWREHDPAGRAAFVPIREAWAVFEPIGLDHETRQTIAIPDRAAIEESYLRELDRYVSQVVEPEASLLLERIERLGPSARLYNRLGVLYARYGLHEEALRWLTEATTLDADHQPFLNLGNIAFLNGEYAEAARWYVRAEERAPDDERVSLAIARVEYELGETAAAAVRYAEVQSRDPMIAAQFAYLGGETGEDGRASDGTRLAGVVMWADAE
jgi:hypothetical protein